MVANGLRMKRESTKSLYKKIDFVLDILRKKVHTLVSRVREAQGENMKKAIMVRQWGKLVKANYDDGIVGVYDEVAGYFTTCHNLTKSQIKRIKYLSKKD